MLYLAIQMAFLLLVSALIGVAIGWWAKRIAQNSMMEDSIVVNNIETDDDIYTLKNRLDKCFDENANLRRDAKAQEAQLNRLEARSDETDDELHYKVIALMDDLQLRDDTILALEKEIEVMKH